MFQIKSFHLKSNHQNGSNRDLNPNRDWDLPITGYCKAPLFAEAYAVALVKGESSLICTSLYYVSRCR